MRRPRFRIASLLALVLFVALAIAALRASDDPWDGGVLGTFLILLSAILMAIHRTNGKRAYWLGFALFGWVYLVASLVPTIEPRLPTTAGLAYLDSKVPGREIDSLYRVIGRVNGGSNVQAVAFSPQGRSLSTVARGDVQILGTWPPGKPLARTSGTSENFVWIGHSLMAPSGAALIGGHLSRFMRGQVAAEN